MARVVPPHRRDPDDSHDSQYYRRGVDDIRNVIVSTEPPSNAEPGALWYNPEGVPEYGVDIGISKDDADQLYTSKDEFEAVADVPPRVEAVETALTGKADTAVVQAVDTRVQRVESALILDTAYPTLQAAMDAGAGGTVLVTTSQTVPVGLTIPPRTRVLVSPGVVLTRQQPTTGDWITVGEGAILDGGEYDGNKASASSFSRAYRAVNVLAGGTIQNAYVHDHNGHGIRLFDNAMAINCISDRNGDAPGASGTGDGFYASDVNGVLIDRCSASGNARMGVTITTNTAAASGVVRDTYAGPDNGYLPFDFESVVSGVSVTVRAERIRGGAVSASGGILTISDSTVSSVHSGTTHAASTQVTMQRVTIPRGATTSPMEVYAHRIDLNDVHITVDATGLSSWAAAFYTRGESIARNVSLTGTVGNGLFFSVPSGSGGSWRTIQDVRTNVTATGNILRVRPTDGANLRSLNNTMIFRVENTRFIQRGTAAPASGTWEVGDVIENTNPTAGGPMGWVCVAAGNPGTWKAYGTIEP